MDEKTKRINDYVNQHKRENYDQLHTLLPKGTKDKVKAYGSRIGLSVNGFINCAINEKMERMDAEEQKSEKK